LRKLEHAKDGRLLFTKKMKSEYTILMPMMLPIHFTFLKNSRSDFPSEELPGEDAVHAEGSRQNPERLQGAVFLSPHQVPGP
jgi:hypothetical protein